MLCDSNKVKDPMKVGRFGLGFKSVFHMTGRYIAYKGHTISTIYICDRLYQMLLFSVCLFSFLFLELLAMQLIRNMIYFFITRKQANFL